MIQIKIRFGQEIVDSLEFQTLQGQLFLERIYHSEMRDQIFCTCLPNVLMHLRYYKKTKRYQVCSNAKMGRNHADWCEYALNLSENELQGLHFSPLSSIKDGEFRLNIKHLKIHIPKGSHVQTHDATATVRPRGVVSRIGIGDLGRELLLRTWANQMEQYKTTQKFYPSARSIHTGLHKLFISHAGIKIHVGKDLNGAELFLSDVLWLGHKKTESFYYYNQSELRPIILAPLIKDSVVIGQDEVIFEVKAYEPDKSYKLSTSLANWNAATLNCSIDFKTHPHFYIAGLGMNRGKGLPPDVQRVELIPVSNRGLVIDSEEQNRVFMALERAKRVFIRPIEQIEGIEGYIPTALLQDCERTIIIEVFDQPESNQSYHVIKNRKMQHYRELENIIPYYWHAYRSKKIPSFPEKSKEVIGTN